MVTDRHVSEALYEMLLAGGTLTIRLLGGESPSDSELPNRFDKEPGYGPE